MKFSAAVAAFLLLSSLAIFASASSSGGGSCDATIELYAGVDGWWESITFRTSPTPYTGDSQVCGDLFPNGALQCCDDATYSAIDNAWATARSDIEAARAAVQNSVSLWESAHDQAASQENAIKQELAQTTLTQDQQNAVIQAYEASLNAYTTFIDSAVSDYATCLESVLKYFIGLVCLGCDPSADRYFTTKNGVNQLKLTQDTCDEMKSDCLPFWRLVYEFIVQILAIDAQLELAFAGQTASASFSVNSEEVGFCGSGDCGDWICTDFYAGANVQTSAAGVTPLAKRADLVLEKMEKNIAAHSASVPTLSAGRAHVVNLVKVLAAVHAKKDSQTTNVYGSSGYQPYSVASKSNLQTSVSDADSAPALSSWIF